jgi:hypothetical protein
VDSKQIYTNNKINKYFCINEQVNKYNLEEFEAKQVNKIVSSKEKKITNNTNPAFKACK